MNINEAVTQRFLSGQCCVSAFSSQLNLLKKKQLSKIEFAVDIVSKIKYDIMIMILSTI